MVTNPFWTARKCAATRYPYLIAQPCSNFVVNHFSIFNAVFFEFTATTFFTYCVFINGGITTLTGFFMSFAAMFVCFLWTARYTGTFMNPALVIACMIKK